MEKKEVINETPKEVKKEKLTYEELTNACHQLSEQARTLYQQLQEANLSNAFSRLNFLFAVLDKAEFFKNYEGFVDKCVDEIVNMITIPETPKEEESA